MKKLLITLLIFVYVLKTSPSQAADEEQEANLTNQNTQIAVKLTDQLNEAHAKDPDIPIDLIFNLVEIAKIGKAAHTVGPKLSPLLQSKNGETRVMVARTLGFIGYNQSNKELIKLLNDPSDIRLNLVAAKSLAMLNAKIAIPYLEKMVKNHWHPYIRSAASKAVKDIISDNTPKAHKGNFSELYFNFQDWSYDQNNEYILPVIQTPSSKALERMTYKVRTFRDWRKNASNKKERIKAPPRTTLRKPTAGLQFNDGWLLGGNDGEFGGELVFKGTDEQAQLIIRKNIHGIFQLGDSYVAVTGLAHMGTNRGMVYKLTKVNGNWQSAPWHALPGAPLDGGMTKDGELIISTNGAGVIILDKNGKFRMAENLPQVDKQSDPFVK